MHQEYFKAPPVHISAGRHKCSFLEKPSIPDLRGPRGGFVVAPSVKASPLGSQFDSKQCCEQFGTHLSCFPQSRCNSLTFGTLFFGVYFLILTHMVVLILFCAFPLFLKMVADISAPKLSIPFRGLISQEAFPEC